MQNSHDLGFISRGFSIVPAALFFILLSCVSAVNAETEYLNGDVTSVSDGDTLKILVDGEEFKVRFYGVDAPETAQRFGDKAAAFTRKRIQGQTVTIIVHDRDQYGRVVGEVYHKGESINRLLAREGLAWWYRNYAQDDGDLSRLSAAAKKAKKGLWADESPVPPWDFRRQKLSATASAAPDEFEVLMALGVRRELLREISAAEFRRELAANHAPARRLGYREAREYMFGEIDDENGRVRLFYTGDTFEANGEIPDGNVVNTEHIWPQSKFGAASGAKSDLHHLQPTWNRANGSRGSLAFAEIEDTTVDEWWAGPSKTTAMPPVGVRDNYSERGGSRWEPREDEKGNVARALFYVYTIYGHAGLNVGWFKPQCDQLVTWHRSDPVDAREQQRNERIAHVQGNTNPFVDNPSLVERAIDCTQ